ncbi:MAG: hypothetical protein AAFU38_14855, partial [Bacteroidota bacterium]
MSDPQVRAQREHYKASQAYEEAVRLLELGHGDASTAQLDRAIQHLDRAIELMPFDSSCRYDRGLAQQRRGRHRAAIADYSQALHLDGPDADTFNNRGLAFAAVQDY